VGRGRAGSEHRREGVEQHRHYLFFEFLEEFHGHLVVPWSLSFGEGFDGMSDIFEGEVSSQPLIHSLRDLGGTLFQQTVCASAMPGVGASEEYRLA